MRWLAQLLGSLPGEFRSGNHFQSDCSPSPVDIGANVPWFPRGGLPAWWLIRSPALQKTLHNAPDFQYSPSSPTSEKSRERPEIILPVGTPIYGSPHVCARPIQVRGRSTRGQPKSRPVCFCSGLNCPNPPIASPDHAVAVFEGSIAGIYSSPGFRMRRGVRVTGPRRPEGVSGQAEASKRR